MTAANLTAQLAQRVMKWDIAPERFIMGGRRWMPRSRFRPTERIEDAFRLLEQAAPQDYTMGTDRSRVFWVKVTIGGTTAEARGRSIASVISHAVGLAVGIAVGSPD